MHSTVKNSYIFLDVDGVLNNEVWYASEECIAQSKNTPEIRHFDPRCILLLNDLTDSTSAKIVVSSSWRIGRTVEELQTLFKLAGITGEVIDKTPRLSFADETYKYSVPRGCEIKAWLEMNKSKLGSKMSKVKYVILDDDSDMLYWQRKNFLQIDNFVGLTHNVIHKAKQILLS